MLSELDEDTDAAGEGTVLGGLDVSDERKGKFDFDKREESDVEVRNGNVYVKQKGESPARCEKGGKRGMD